MQVFVKINSRIITFDFEDKITKIEDLIIKINIKENLNISNIYFNSLLLNNELIMTKENFGDKILNI